MKILITAGATWVKIDAVRILTNRFTGKTGLYLAKEFKKNGHKVKLLVNSHCLDEIRDRQVITYQYFDEFKKAINKLLKQEYFDVIIHTAAVSDYKLKNSKSGKIASGKKQITLKLVPVPKIIKSIRSLAKKSLLIQFKLETKREGLIEAAYASLKSNKSDYVVANALDDLSKAYRAFLIDKDKKVKLIRSKQALFTTIHKIVNLSQNNKIKVYNYGLLD
ncbi:MAG: phosphopantothenoylcysteine decarboxylase [Omnitrophica bacterium]|nr:phosphopantothenoylcysteine decarboxylase [Candidatus Omnitrophota bacterium]